MPWALALLEDCPPGEWSERMLIGCPGPGETKARELSDEHSQKRCAPDTGSVTFCRKGQLTGPTLTRRLLPQKIPD